MEIVITQVKKKLNYFIQFSQENWMLPSENKRFS